MKQTILLHYHEINLKGNNRGWFESHLQQHLSAVLKGVACGRPRKFAGRLLIELYPESPVEDIVSRIRKVFGIANLVVAWEIPASMDSIRSAISELIPALSFRTFKIDARRGTKDFELNSQQINQQLGAFVQEMTGAQVRLQNPDTVFFVEVVADRVFIYLEKITGAGGLPTGTGGKALCLLSGGIDSPVAAYRLMRRGCRVAYVHFHSFPHTSVESQEKVRRLLRALSCFQMSTQLYMVPFAEVQREIVAYAPPALRVILYRRFMVRIAEELARREGAAALITGDSLGQVASQTLENMRTISAVATIPIFRPLIGNDKEEIMQVAREIGTYEISILADQDCCSLFVPKHPETMSGIAQAEAAESSLDVPQLVRAALENSSREVIAPVYSSPSEESELGPQESIGQN